ncbi:ATP-binding protein [Caballeronia sp. ATUFL_F1_KS4A]|uniref:ATP-binding protein n=1 Tax=Caballeronia sp. ATUFL_F1_KS4A TaxID=2921768 RepID=UPI002027EA0B|nr:ATP-binding protein [Caballeronia sp. ATUFL_F1_KS4A]
MVALRNTFSRLYCLDRPGFLRRYLARSFPFARLSSIVFALHGTIWNMFGVPSKLTQISLVILLTRYIPPLIFIGFPKWSRHHYHWVICTTFVTFIGTTITLQMFSIPSIEIFELTLVKGRPYSVIELQYSYLTAIFYILFLTRLPFLHASILTLTSYAYLVIGINYVEGTKNLSSNDLLGLYRLSTLFAVVTLGLYVNYWLQARERALYEEKIKTQIAGIELKTKNAELSTINNENTMLIERLQQAKNAVEAKNRELDQVNNDQAELMWRAGHNVRNGLLPVWSAVGKINNALDANPVDLKAVHEQITKISTGFSLSIEVLNRLMRMNQYQTGKVTPDLKLIDIRDLVIKIHDQLNETAKKKNLFFVCYVGHGPAYAYTDEVMIIECVFNLVSNSLKYTYHKDCPDIVGESPATVHDKRICNAKQKNRPPSGVVIGVVPHHDVIRVHIVDTGIGIPKTDIDKVWRPFFRVERRPNAESLGLGLYTVSRIISALDNHYISIPWSKEGIGSHFLMDIPRAVLPMDLLSSSATDKVDSVIDGAYVLVLGKDRRQTMETAQLIELWKGRVVYGPSARSVLNRIAENERRPDAIIVDDQLIDGSATDVIAVIRRELGAVPCLVIADTIGALERSKYISMSTVLTKPFGHDDVRKKLHEVLLMGKTAQDSASNDYTVQTAPSNP